MAQKKETLLTAYQKATNKTDEEIAELMRPAQRTVKLPDYEHRDKLEEAFREILKQGKKILIHGDYDCDGLTGSVVLYRFLKSCGFDVKSFMPTRERGYGLNKITVDEHNDYDALITVDCGISNSSELEYAASLGMFTVITDHHTVPEDFRNVVDFCLHPKIMNMPELQNFAGVGMAFWLCWNLRRLNPDFDFEYHSQIVAIGSVADVVPLVGLNRELVKTGLYYLWKRPLTGLAALNEVIDKSPPYHEEYLSFQVNPRLNAAGRLGDPILSFAILATDDYQAALRASKKLDKINIERKELCAEYLEKLTAKIESENLNTDVLVVELEDAPHGIIGILAANLVDKYDKPAFVMAIEGDDCRGSVRCPDWYNAIENMNRVSHVFTKYGGHQCAAGFSLLRSNVNEMRESLNKDFVKPEFVKIESIPVPIDLVTMENVKELNKLRPFGAGLPKPTFSSSCLLTEVKSDKSGVHFLGKSNGLKVVWWKKFDPNFTENDWYDTIYTVDTSTFFGRTSVQLDCKSIVKRDYETDVDCDIPF